MTNKKRLTLTEVFQLENNPVDPAQHGKDIKKQALIKAFNDIAPYVPEDDPTIAALNDLLAGAKWEGGLPKAGQVKFGEGLSGLGKSKASQKGAQAKQQAISTAIKDLKPHVPEGDPTIAALNDLLSKSSWEAGEDGKEPTVDWGEFKEGCDECIIQDDEGCPCDKCKVAPPADVEDQEILLDLDRDTEEDSPISIPEEEPFMTSSPMIPMTAPEVIVVKIGNHGDELADLSRKPAIEISTPLNSQEGAPGGPDFDQPNDLSEDAWEDSTRGRDPLGDFNKRLDRDEPVVGEPRTVEEDSLLDDPYYAELKDPDPELMKDPDYREYLKDLEREYAQERASGRNEQLGGILGPDELGF